MTNAQVDLLEVANRVVAEAAANEQLEVVAVHDLDTEIRVYEGEVEQFTASESFGVGVRGIRDDRQGFAWAGTLDADVLTETLAEARDNAVFGTVDDFLGLAQPDGVDVPDLDLYNTGPMELGTEAKIELARELEAKARSADSRIIGMESSDYVDGVRRGALVSTSGVSTTSSETSAYVTATALASDGDDTQIGFGFHVARDPRELDIDVAASDAADRATRLLGATQPETERTTVILDPFVTAQFLGILGGTMSGEAVQKGYSLFANRLGDEVAASNFTLIDDPTDPRMFTAGETDGEGLASRRNVLVDGGRLEMFVHNAYTARKAGTAPTGSAVRGFSSVPSVGTRALQLVPGTQSQAELIAMVGDGVLIQEVSGIHSGVNPVSGDFSTGAEGLRIRDGALAEPIREVTIASTLQKMLGDILAVGSDIEYLPMSAAGVSLVVADVTMSGQ